MTLKITFNNHPDGKKAIEVLSGLSDAQLSHQRTAVQALLNAGLKYAAQEVERMSLDEYYDFVTNNVESEN